MASFRPLILSSFLPPGDTRSEHIRHFSNGVDSDIKEKSDFRHEHLRRLAEGAQLLFHAGLILIGITIELAQEDLELIQATIHTDKIGTMLQEKGILRGSTANSRS
jgi:hypothetical protein